MIRILIFILSIVFIAALLTVLAGADGRTTAEAFGLKFDIHTGGAAIIVLLVIGAAIVLTSVYKDLRRLPHDLKIREREAARERGVAALTRGLEAVAVGDAESAQHHARVARRSLPDSSLTRLLAAQAAHLAGDDGAAKESFTAMLEAPESGVSGPARALPPCNARRRQGRRQRLCRARLPPARECGLGV
ncbi:MAG: heme biosynthesis HemY N-terminal domain-containing protein [Parvularculaceae bacterium]